MQHKIIDQQCSNNRICAHRITEIRRYVAICNLSTIGENENIYGHITGTANYMNCTNADSWFFFFENIRFKREIAEPKRNRLIIINTDCKIIKQTHLKRRCKLISCLQIVCTQKKKRLRSCRNLFIFSVGAQGFEPRTLCL